MKPRVSFNVRRQTKGGCILVLRHRVAFFEKTLVARGRTFRAKIWKMHDTLARVGRVYPRYFVTVAIDDVVRVNSKGEAHFFDPIPLGEVIMVYAPLFRVCCVFNVPWQKNWLLRSFDQGP